ncbi:hypothetical protein MMC28_006682 [Mycoblastus sanguinarius]|nr:hypothetical protein [Mycoblastus sanguinarius]
MPSLTSLAEEALVQAKKLDEHLLSQGRQHTSFEHDTLIELPPDLVEAQEALVNSAHTLKRLALRPEGVLAEIMWNCADEVSLGAINEFRLADHVPPTGSTTFRDIASSSRLPENLVERLMRHAMGNHIFTEKEPGQVQHTASSSLLATDADLSDTIAMVAQEIWQVCTRAVDAMKLYPDSQEPSETAFSLINKPGVPMFAFLAEHPERARRFGSAMSYFARLKSFDINHLIHGYP